MPHIRIPYSRVAPHKFFRPLVSLSCLVLLLGIVGSITPVAPAAASSTNQVSPGAVAQSYNADSSVLPGMIVALKPKDQTTVMPLSSQGIRNMIGVVVPVNGADIVLTPRSAAAQQVLVAATGRYELLVTNQNGPVKTGDYLTISALDGIGMKAGTDQTEVIGRAAGNFSGANNVIDTVHLKSSLGRTTTVAVGHIPVDVRLAPNPLFQHASKLPDFLTKAANSVANKPVNPVRIYLSMLVLLATLFMTGSMFYGGVRGSVTAIGRNPLAKKAVSRGLFQAFIFGLIVFVAGILAVYVILI